MLSCCLFEFQWNVQSPLTAQQSDTGKTGTWTSVRPLLRDKHGAPAPRARLATRAVELALGSLLWREMVFKDLVHNLKTSPKLYPTLNFLKGGRAVCTDETSASPQHAAVWSVIAEWFRLKGPQEVSGPTSCSQQGQLQGQTRMLSDVSSWVLKTSRDGACTAPLGSVLYFLHCLKVLHLVWTSWFS